MDSIVHFEIPYDDLERVKKFYTKVFGWIMSDAPDMEYTFAIQQKQMKKDGRQNPEQLMVDLKKDLIM